MTQALTLKLRNFFATQPVEKAWVFGLLPLSRPIKIKSLCMREIVRDPARLEHILECIARLFEFTRDVKFEDYVGNMMMKFAVIKKS